MENLQKYFCSEKKPILKDTTGQKICDSKRIMWTWKGYTEILNSNVKMQNILEEIKRSKN